MTVTARIELSNSCQRFSMRPTTLFFHMKLPPRLDLWAYKSVALFHAVQLGIMAPLSKEGDLGHRPWAVRTFIPDRPTIVVGSGFSESTPQSEV